MAGVLLVTPYTERLYLAVPTRYGSSIDRTRSIAQRRSCRMQHLDVVGPDGYLAQRLALSVPTSMPCSPTSIPKQFLEFCRHKAQSRERLKMGLTGALAATRSAGDKHVESIHSRKHARTHTYMHQRMGKMYLLMLSSSCPMLGKHDNIPYAI